MNLNVELLEWQQEVFADDARFKVIAAGRRTGKTRLAAWTLILEALQAESGHVFYVAPTQAQARDNIWGMLKELGHEVITAAHINNLQLTLVNGATISLKGADRPDTMRGVSLAYLVVDEMADMKPEVFDEILRPALMDREGRALFIGTPKGRNHFYDMYCLANNGDDPEYKAWHYTSYDNPTISKAEIDKAKVQMSSFAFRQENMASFEARGSAMFKEEWVKYGDKPPKDGEYYITCDLAGFEDMAKAKGKKSRLDDTAISVVKVNTDGWYVRDVISGRWDLNETAMKIFQAVEKYKPMAMGIEKGIAKQAVMTPLMDLMKRRGRFFNVQELTHGNRKKTDRIMWALQGRFENGWITLHKGDWNIKFLDQLFQFPDTLTHDDMVDSLAYIDQIATISYANEADMDLDTWEAQDLIAGY